MNPSLPCLVQSLLWKESLNRHILLGEGSGALYFPLTDSNLARHEVVMQVCHFTHYGFCRYGKGPKPAKPAPSWLGLCKQAFMDKCCCNCPSVWSPRHRSMSERRRRLLVDPCCSGLTCEAFVHKCRRPGAAGASAYYLLKFLCHTVGLRVLSCFFRERNP
jgi:hypothetical protein